MVSVYNLMLLDIFSLIETWLVLIANNHAVFQERSREQWIPFFQVFLQIFLLHHGIVELDFLAVDFNFPVCLEGLRSNFSLKKASSRFEKPGRKWIVVFVIFLILLVPFLQILHPEKNLNLLQLVLPLVISLSPYRREGRLRKLLLQKRQSDWH